MGQLYARTCPTYIGIVSYESGLVAEFTYTLPYINVPLSSQGKQRNPIFIETFKTRQFVEANAVALVLHDVKK